MKSTQSSDPKFKDFLILLLRENLSNGKTYALPIKVCHLDGSSATYTDPNDQFTPYFLVGIGCSKKGSLAKLANGNLLCFVGSWINEYENCSSKGKFPNFKQIYQHLNNVSSMSYGTLSVQKDFPSMEISKLEKDPTIGEKNEMLIVGLEENNAYNMTCFYVDGQTGLRPDAKMPFENKIELIKENYLSDLCLVVSANTKCCTLWEVIRSKAKDEASSEISFLRREISVPEGQRMQYIDVSPIISNREKITYLTSCLGKIPLGQLMSSNELCLAISMLFKY